MLFVVWGVQEVFRRLDVGRKRREERFFVDMVGNYWGLRREPGESNDAFKARLKRHVEEGTRYPRSPM